MSADGTFSGGVAVITGAGAGIGAGIARHAVSLGMTVVLVDIDADAVVALRDELCAAGGAAVDVACDVRDPDAMRELVLGPLAMQRSGFQQPPPRDLEALAATGHERGAPLPCGWHIHPELAAAGLTNKRIGEQLFLSHRTVSTHLYRIFPKLGITSRAALRDALATVPRPRRDDP